MIIDNAMFVACEVQDCATPPTLMSPTLGQYGVEAWNLPKGWPSDKDCGAQDAAHLAARATTVTAQPGVN